MNLKTDTPRKAGFLQWECDVVTPTVTYTLVAYTRNGAYTKALRYAKTLEDRSNAA